MGPKGSGGEKVDIFRLPFHCDRKEDIIFVSRVKKEALAQEEWKDLMENRSDTILSYRDTKRVNLDLIVYMSCMHIRAKQCNEKYYTYVIKLSLLWWIEPAPRMLIYCLPELLLWITGQWTVYSTFYV